MGHWEDNDGRWFFTEDDLIKELLDPITMYTHDCFDDYINEKYDAATFLHMLMDKETIDPYTYYDEVEKMVEGDVRE